MSCGFHGMSLYTPNPRRAYKETWLYTAYLGRVKLNVAAFGTTKVLMETSAGRNNDVVLRVVDAQVGRIDPNARPTLRQLMHIPPAVVDVNENCETFYQIQHMEALKAKIRGDAEGQAYHDRYIARFARRHPTLYRQLREKHKNMRYTPQGLHQLYIKNVCVDILFVKSLFLRFLRDKLDRDSINNNRLLLSVFNVPDLDNAFYADGYMMYGNGVKTFYPLGGADVSAHELTHGLIQFTAGLEYLGHSGALNESFADVISTAFEFWLYKLFNENNDPDDDLQGDSDWLLGEDIGKTMKYLRNLRDPTKAKNPQPKEYKGQHWANPDNMAHDRGGVHINSGITNHCFYLLSEATSLDTALPLFYNCLLRMERRSDFIDFRDTLIKCAPESIRGTVQMCLNKVGLTPKAISDWGLSPAKNKIPKSQSKRKSYPNQHVPFIRGLCCPHCPTLNLLSSPNPTKFEGSHQSPQDFKTSKPEVQRTSKRVRFTFED